MSTGALASGIVFACVVTLSVGSTPLDFYDFYDGYVLNGHNQQKISGVSPAKCATLCLQGTNTVPIGTCLSFDYDCGACVLSMASKDTNSLDYGPGDPIDRYDYYHKKEALQFFDSYGAKALSGHNDEVIPSVPDPNACALHCIQGYGNVPVGSCRSFEMDNTLNNCILSVNSKDTTGGSLDDSNPPERFNYYQRLEIDFCAADPCVHGNCTSELDRYSCDCEAGWGGTDCDEVSMLGFFDFYDGQILRGHDQQRISGISPAKCATLCLQGTTTVPIGACMSFDYESKSAEARTCVLSTSSKYTNPSDYGPGHPITDYDYYHKKEALQFFDSYGAKALSGHNDEVIPSVPDPNACALHCIQGYGNVPVGSCRSFEMDNTLNNCILSVNSKDTTGGSLDDSNPPERFNYYQRLEIDFCAADPCVHGNCTSELDRYSCDCEAGWGGVDCDAVPVLDFFDFYEDHVLSGHDEERIVGIAPAECATLCLQGTTSVPIGTCLSFDYHNDGTGVCLLSTASKDTNSSDYGPDNLMTTHDYYHKKGLLQFFDFYGAKALSGHNEEVVSPISDPNACALHCIQGYGNVPVGSCRSFEMDNRDNKCILSVNSKDTTGGSLDDSNPPERFNYYQRLGLDFCATVLCAHGSCTNEPDRYRCTCDPGWGGSHCDADINECDSNPCLNGGRCTQGTPGTYGCTCTVGWTGNNCEQDVDYCAVNPCWSGGTCVDGLTGYMCICPPRTFGQNCETVYNNTCYRQSRDALSHKEASAACVSMGGQLADVKDQSDYQMLANVIQQTNDVSHWTFIKSKPPQLFHSDGSHLSEIYQPQRADTFDAPRKNQPSARTYQPQRADKFDAARTYQPFARKTQPWDSAIRCLTTAFRERWKARAKSSLQEGDEEPPDKPCLGEGQGTWSSSNSTSGSRSNTSTSGSRSNTSTSGSSEGSVSLEESNESDDLPEINECESNPCQHGGTCLDHVNSYNCACHIGYAGDLCENVINYCDPDPCPFGWTCSQDQVAGFHCEG
ncbi:NOTCH1 [Branchiostoma lanceolatum]|uniref:NOTCH1 protein n=1 Tax=Branchiostoma lanceolatum TaxID=7740 RepID=A0A8J9Z2E5_BRALA|nr:NOTCH1 [Branchiostoma lanceolatum]